MTKIPALEENGDKFVLTSSGAGAEGCIFSLSWKDTIVLSGAGFLEGSSPEITVGNSVSTGSPNR